MSSSSIILSWLQCALLYSNNYLDPTSAMNDDEFACDELDQLPPDKWDAVDAEAVTEGASSSSPMSSGAGGKLVPIRSSSCILQAL